MNWDYIAGFFDGEGSVSLSYRKSGNLKNVLLSITQCQLDVLQQIRDFVGEGKIDVNHHQGSKNWKKHWKPSYHFRLSKRSSVVSFLENIRDKVIVKKNKINETLLILQEMDRKRKEHLSRRKEKVQKIHELRSLNMSWKEIAENLGQPGKDIAGNIRKFFARYSEEVIRPVLEHYKQQAQQAIPDL